MSSFLIGQAASYSISTQIVSPGASKLDVGYLMMLEASICGLALLSVIILFKDKADSNIVLITDHNRRTVKEELIDLFKDWNFVILFSSSFISAGTGNYFAVIMEVVVTEHGFSSKEVSYIGVISICTGIASCILFSFIASSTQKFKLVCLCTTGGTVIGYIILYLSLTSGNFLYLALASMIYGFVLMPCYTVPLEYACEITFPIRENLTSGLINCFGQVFALIPVAIAYMFNNEPHKSMAIGFFLQIFAFFLMLGTKEDLKRRDEEYYKKIVDPGTLGIN